MTLNDAIHNTNGVLKQKFDDGEVISEQIAIQELRKQFMQSNLLDYIPPHMDNRVYLRMAVGELELKAIKKEVDSHVFARTRISHSYYSFEISIGMAFGDMQLGDVVLKLKYLLTNKISEQLEDFIKLLEEHSLSPKNFRELKKEYDNLNVADSLKLREME